MAEVLGTTSLGSKMTSNQAKSQTLRFTHLSKNVLTGDEAELYELSNLAGVTMDPHVFKIIMDLLHMNVAPMAIERMLKTMMSQTSKRSTTLEGAENDPLGPPGYNRSSTKSSSSRSRNK